MKMHLIINSVNFLILIYLISVQAVNGTPDGRRGIARMMNFSEKDHESVVIGKRDKVTWYNGYDLKEAACFSRNGLPRFDAGVNDMIGAMAMHNFEQCNKCMQITNNRQKSKKIVVQIVDKCAACKIGKWIDLTPGAFKKLSEDGDLDVGVLDISYKPVKCPEGGVFDKLAKMLVENE
ncbi:uncharacterized protein BX663DRAFT_541493 [Cokeromyces recurvatus]|uniref:uncharacterized protein n=1 Tax=Cokeromyces recurvatus TaxID=90255 RepID=UPI0022207FD9|nr:uncharacterized protein BX663DRAFT_541493 [Cokeromyces recurvatus]KAI7905307.1 hypothetical protein BX663DRAFT_541493 [Cokeromyces recurvatus]